MSQSIWKKMLSLDDLNAFSSSTMVELLGIVFTEISDECLVATMPVDERTQQPFGLLHGGASAALLETLGSVAATAASEENEYCVGVELNINHVRAKRNGTVTGTTSPVHIGKTIQVWTVDICDESGSLISTGRLTLAVRKNLPGSEKA